MKIFSNYTFFLRPTYRFTGRQKRKDYLKQQYYFECECLACERDIGVYHQLTLGIAPNFTYYMGDSELLNISEKAAMKIYQKACKYLRSNGFNVGNKKMIIVQEVLKMYFYVLLNNMPLDWKFGELQEANQFLKMRLAEVNK